MKRIISLILAVVCVMSLGLSGCSTSSQINTEESNAYLEPENSLAQEFVQQSNEEIARDIYNKLRTEHIYCQYGQSDGSNDVVYFKNSGYTLGERSWIEVDLPERIIFYNPDPDYLKTYFNLVVPLWDSETEGNQIIDELKSKTYENDNGYKYNIIEENNVKYHIYYSLKNSYKISHLYVYFEDNET